MILRRISRALKEQNWTAIGLEFVLLVAGVFFGIQVSNWNESRHEARQARENLSRIQDDLATDRRNMQAREVFWRQVADYGRGAIHYAETGELVDGSAWPTLLAFYQASQLFHFVPSDTTYQELRSAGELGLFSSSEMRKQLADYYVTGAGYAANFLFRQDPEYRKLVRGLTPTIASAHIWSTCHKQSVEQQEMVPCDAPMSEEAARAVLDRYLADPRILPELRFWITNLDVMTDLIGQHRSAAQLLDQRIEAALER